MIFEFQNNDSGDNASNKDTSSLYPSVTVTTTTAKKAFIASTKNELVDNELAVAGIGKLCHFISSL